MRPVLIRIAVFMAACGAIGAPAGFASAAQSAVETIGLLEAEGYHVYIGRIGDAPLEQCIVTSIRNPQTVTKDSRQNNLGFRCRGGYGCDNDRHGGSRGPKGGRGNRAAPAPWWAGV